METDKSLKLIKPQKVVKISFNKLLFIDQELYDNIDALPNILKYRIYIMKVREFWKNYVPLTAQIPLWYPRYSKQTNLAIYGVGGKQKGHFATWGLEQLYRH